VKKLIGITIISTILLYATVAPRNSVAAYKPAPTHLVKAATQKHRPTNKLARRAWIICKYWPKNQCKNALNVAWCESTFDTKAKNGQYLGIFQMGKHERATFGHGKTVYHQAAAAKKYYQIAAWHPWECKPNRYML